MAIAWKEEVEKRKDDLLTDLFELLKIPSVRDDDQASPDAPVGPGPKEALEAFLDMAERDGFTTKNVENIAGHVEYGQGDQTLGVLGHVDVVPVDDFWDTNPFQPEIKDGKLYARGASDDKGPTLAAYYALKIIKELELPIDKKIRFIVGTDEESGWECMDRYFANEAKPDFGFSPDADFPIINGEKGMYSVKLTFDDVTDKLVSFEAGQRENMVPGQATAVVRDIKDDFSEIEQSFNAYEGIDLTVIDQGTGSFAISVTGKASHAMAPANGINAATHLAKFLTMIDADLANDPFIDFLGQTLHEDYYGKALGIDHNDDIMGVLTVNPGVVRREGLGQSIALNIRVPKGKDYAELDARFAELAAEKHFSLGSAQKTNKQPHYVPADDPLVKVLLDVYHKQTGLEAHEKSIGGGTYGRLLERGVAYGALFPDSQDTMHQANEFIALDDLFRATAIYCEAIYELVKPGSIA
ncbi:dipeptidase PepV [Aerococcus kribbianus]|uniref:Dipeptidase PepV n=1 Tax=Aerococcus kribbianus TaxID=2999064 RepID=A0A9X3FUF5_9LACT|nr:MULTISPECIES: dipeptidase PepV [unclassified Aerococcus]MCZ0717086.1 dipeptidase PepV [Aerococcus sp. YH-aer221]MCZ0725374.1 dipeptidase PepV [Aerococcus sp. YH-aer222]